VARKEFRRLLFYGFSIFGREWHEAEEYVKIENGAEEYDDVVFVA
jgi:hypothetical protein